MQQTVLFHESINDALDACVKACGGAKKVAGKLWPEKTADAAHRLLLQCLNEDRQEKLGPEQVLFILKLAREAGFHDGINFISRESGYSDPQPMDPEDEKTLLMRAFIDAQKNMKQIADRMERFGMVRAAA